VSLLEEEFAANKKVNETHLAAAIFELAEKRAIDITYTTRQVKLARRLQPIRTLDAVQEHLLDCTVPRRGDGVVVPRTGTGSLRIAAGAMNRYLTSLKPNPRQSRRERVRERERRTVAGSALSLHLWLCDGATEAAMQPVCNEWVAGTRNQPEWWIAPGRWPDEHGNMLALTYGMLVQSFK